LTISVLPFDQQWYLTARHGDGVSLVTKLAAYTASADHLPLNYQFSIGGMYSVRGYDEAIAGGDEMALWCNELQLPWHAAFNWLAAGARQHAYLFYDWGLVRQNAVDIAIGARNLELLPQTSTRLVGGGVGLDLAFISDITLRLEYAVAQAGIDSLVGPGDSRIHASLDWRAF
jgi:hemolysin activation/secretion protein